ncbi:hypothetical protein FJY94_00235 [Candidatus Kaiserbacteria bacterium]|nr:hypothetical protein [Candidatus Kaiserbacteria bacterium]
MKWRPLVGWGVVVYAVGLLAGVTLLTWKVGEVSGARELVYLAVGITAIIAGRTLHLSQWKDILPYSLFWMAEIIVLDGLVMVPQYGLVVYQDASAWIVYGIVAIAPLLAPHFRRSYDLPSVT